MFILYSFELSIAIREKGTILYIKLLTLQEWVV